MISINLIRPSFPLIPVGRTLFNSDERGKYVNDPKKPSRLFFVANPSLTEYLLHDAAAFTRVPASDGQSALRSDFVTDPLSAANPSNSNPATYIPNPSLSPQLSDHLMGKSPLRLVAQRRRANAGESHYWNETLECGHSCISYPNELSDTEPTAKRRRCQKCKGEQPLLYRPYTPIPLEKDCLTLRVVDYLNWAQDNEERVQRRDDIAIARLAVILAGQGDPEPWRWAFMQLLGGTPEKLIPIFITRLSAHRDPISPDATTEAESATNALANSLPPKKPSQSIGRLKDEEVA